jgi:hypothetical protein
MRWRVRSGSAHRSGGTCYRQAGAGRLDMVVAEGDPFLPDPVDAGRPGDHRPQAAGPRFCRPTPSGVRTRRCGLSAALTAAATRQARAQERTGVGIGLVGAGFAGRLHFDDDLPGVSGELEGRLVAVVHGPAAFCGEVGSGCSLATDAGVHPRFEGRMDDFANGCGKRRANRCGCRKDRYAHGGLFRVIFGGWGGGRVEIGGRSACFHAYSSPNT